MRSSRVRRVKRTARKSIIRALSRMPRSKRSKRSKRSNKGKRTKRGSKRNILDELRETLSLPELESDEPPVSVNVPKKKKKSKKKKKKKSKAWSAKLHGKGKKGKKGKKSHKKKHKKKMKGGSEAEQAKILMSLSEGRFKGPTHVIQNYPPFDGRLCFIEDKVQSIVSMLKQNGNPGVKEDYNLMLAVEHGQLKEIPQ